VPVGGGGPGRRFPDRVEQPRSWTVSSWPGAAWRVGRRSRIPTTSAATVCPSSAVRTRFFRTVEGPRLWTVDLMPHAGHASCSRIDSGGRRGPVRTNGIGGNRTTIAFARKTAYCLQAKRQRGGPKSRDLVLMAVQTRRGESAIESAGRGRHTRSRLPGRHNILP